MSWQKLEEALAGYEPEQKPTPRIKGGPGRCFIVDKNAWVDYKIYLRYAKFIGAMETGRHMYAGWKEFRKTDGEILEVE